jgi:hypothetical protein
VLDHKFAQDVRRWVVSLGKFRRYILLLSTIFLPFILATAGLLSGAIPDWKPYIVPVQISAVIAAFAIGAGLFVFDQSPVHIFQSLTHSLARSAELERRLTESQAEIVQLSAHVNIASVASRAVEAVLLSDGDREGLEAVVVSVLEQCVDNRSRLFHITDDESWNFAVYIENGNGVLECLHCRRNFGQPGDVHRAWPIGFGHVGLAFQQRGELCTEDVAGQQVFHGKGENARGYDAERYRGVVSIPIPHIRDEQQPVGVLVATSSRVGRYTVSNVQPLRDMAQSFGAILSHRRIED